MGRCLEAAKLIKEQNEKPSAPVELSERASSIAARRMELLQEAERIITARLDVIDERRWHVRIAFSADELAVFDSIPWTDEQLRVECGRHKTINAWQARVGTRQQRAAARKKLEKLTSELNDEGKRGDELRQQIAKLQDELSGLGREQRATAITVEQHEKAVAELRKLAPSHVTEQYHRSIAKLAPREHRLSELASRIEFIKKMTAWEIDGGIDCQTRAVDYARRNCPEAVVQAHPLENPTVHLFHWQQHIAGLASEIPGLEKQLSEGRELLAREKADAETLLDVYVL